MSAFAWAEITDYSPEPEVAKTRWSLDRELTRADRTGYAGVLTHTTSDGETMAIADMANGHLHNTLRLYALRHDRYEFYMRYRNYISSARDRGILLDYADYRTSNVWHRSGVETPMPSRFKSQPPEVSMPANTQVRNLLNQLENALIDEEDIRLKGALPLGLRREGNQFFLKVFDSYEMIEEEIPEYVYHVLKTLA